MVQLFSNMQLGNLSRAKTLLINIAEKQYAFSELDAAMNYLHENET